MNDRKMISGTPWHVGFVFKEEEDPRRHRARCINYDREKKKCLALNTRCGGAAHCSMYSEQAEIKAGSVNEEKETPDYIKKAVAELERKEKKRNNPHYNPNYTYTEENQPEKSKTVINDDSGNIKKTRTRPANKKQKAKKELPEYAFKGALVHHKIYGNGLVYDIKNGYISIIFTSGTDADFNIDMLEKIKVLSLRDGVNIPNNDLGDFMTPPTNND